LKPNTIRATTAILIVATVVGCNSRAPQSNSSASGASAPIKVTLSHRPSGTAALSWDPQSQNINAKLQMVGLAPGGAYAIDIYQGACDTIGDVAVPLPEVTADGAGALNASITSTQPAPGGLLPHTALSMHLNGGAPISCGEITSALTSTTLTMAPLGQPLQGSANLTYEPGNKTLIVATSASGLAPGSAHAQQIGLGTCEAQGPVKYPLNDLVASASGAAYQTTIIQNVDQGPPPSGWYLNVYFGPPAQPLQSGQPTPDLQPVMCGNIGGR
jgi:hypothetical protein